MACRPEYKRFIREEYGVSTSERSMRAIANRMKANGILSASLEEILDHVDQLALPADIRESLSR